jgi:O-antigen biosynthesis protein WbqP
MDRFIALVLVILLSPLLCGLLLITFFDLRCNPIFVQKRTVSGDLVFNFYKIRSMSKNAPKVPTGQLNNPQLYISRWGKFLRSNSLDELLNLICIIQGDMKFIGPRPIMPSEHDLINLRIKNKIKSKPGITGFAQINGRDEISVFRKVACERIYETRKSSAIFRLSIILNTAIIVLKKSGISH